MLDTFDLRQAAFLLDDAWAEAERLNLPLSLPEFRATLPDEGNHGPKWKAVAEKWSRPGVHRDEAMEAVEKVLEGRVFAIDRDLDRSVDLEFPELEAFRSAADAFLKRALKHARALDFDAAWPDWELAVRVGRALRTDALALPFSTGLEIEARAIHFLPRLLEPAQFSPYTMESLRDRFAAFRPDDNLDQMVKGEGYFGIAGLRSADRRGGAWRGLLNMDLIPNLLPQKIVRKGRPKSIPGQAFLTRHLQAWLILHQAEDMREGLDAAYDEARTWGTSGHIVRSSLGSLIDLRSGCERLGALRLVGRVLMTAMAERALRKEWPREIELPKDPFAEQPIGYSVSGERGRVFTSVPPKLLTGTGATAPIPARDLSISFPPR